MARPVIRLKAGNDRTVRIAILDAFGAARDLTGEWIEFRAAPRLDAATAVLSKVDGDGVTVIDAEAGIIDIVFTRAETLAGLPGVMLWEVKVTEAGGDVITLDFGTADQPQTYGLMLIESALLAAG